MQDINAGLVVFMTLKSKDGLSAAAHTQTDGYSLIKIRQHRQISLRDGRLKGKGKGVWAPKKREGAPKHSLSLPFQAPATQAIDGLVRLH